MPISQQFFVRTLAELTAHKEFGAPGQDQSRNNSGLASNAADQ
jgi:hypothetical protein